MAILSTLPRPKPSFKQSLTLRGISILTCSLEDRCPFFGAKLLI
jgi:hypothetical protein